jgi:hypothetical protein
MLPRTSPSWLLSKVHLLPSSTWLHAGFSAAFIGVLGYAPLQGGETAAVVIAYRGPSNESVAPIVLTSPGLTCADVQRIMAARRVTLAPTQCPIEVTTIELAALTKSLKAITQDSVAKFSFQPELLRATILGTEGLANDVGISREHALRALDIIAQEVPPARYAALGPQLTEMRRRVSLAPAELVPLPRLDCGLRAAGVDDDVQRRIIYDLTRLPPTWSVRTWVSSNTATSRFLELTSDRVRVFVSISYLVSSDDAARSVRCGLSMISVPRVFPAVADIGDEAYAMSTSHLLFRIGALMVHVQSSDESLDTQKAVAIRLIASMQPGQPGGTTPVVPPIGARVRIKSPQLGPGWRVGMFNRTRQEPPCYGVLLFDHGAPSRIAMTVPAKAVTRLELSRLYPGSPGSPTDPDPGAAAHDGETWANVPLDSILQTGRVCPESIARR